MLSSGIGRWWRSSEYTVVLWALTAMLCARIQVASASAQTLIPPEDGGRLFIGITYIEPPYVITVEDRMLLVNGFVLVDFGELAPEFQPGTASDEERRKLWQATGGWIYANLTDEGLPELAVLDSVAAFLERAGLDVVSVRGSEFTLGHGLMPVLYDPAHASPRHLRDDYERRRDAPQNRAERLMETLSFRNVYFANRGSGLGFGARTNEERDRLLDEAMRFIAGEMPKWEHAERMKTYLDSYEQRPMTPVRVSDWTREEP